jgi:hypothetical protein
MITDVFVGVLEKNIPNKLALMGFCRIPGWLHLAGGRRPDYSRSCV